MFDAWKLGDFAPGEGLAAEAFKDRFDAADWLDVPVPGDVHRTLIDSGRIEDPFYDRNEERCSWVEDREWWYRTSFDGPQEALVKDERARLVFHGLDTFVTIWLNGEEIGHHENMFREAVFDVTDALRIGTTNTLALCFHRPLDNAVPSPPEPRRAVLVAAAVSLPSARLSYPASARWAFISALKSRPWFGTLR